MVSLLDVRQLQIYHIIINIYEKRHSILTNTYSVKKHVLVFLLFFTIYLFKIEHFILIFL